MSLDQIDHIVVLMLENRSFDHMLGYLKREGGRQDVDGLTGNEVNFHNGTAFPSQRMASPIMNGDPCHEWDCVKEQLDNNNGGFIDNYAKVAASHPEFIMDYFNATDLPVYDHLAREFCICDRWFSAIPGPTQPNRAYALAGTSESLKANLTPKELLLGKGWGAPTIFELIPNSASWKIYSHDIAGLRFFKKFRTALVPQIDKIDKFFKHAAAGTLANVTWIDPDFGIAVYPGAPNDDHPPHDTRHTQNLVSRIYNALLSSPAWSKTLLIVTYDEHGGYYDHVSPRQFTPADSDPEFAKYGVRVPAFLISPWVGKQVAYGSTTHGLQLDKVLFDHTSILRTILRRFCTPAGGAIPNMTARVDAANDLSALLTETQPRTDCTATPLIPNVPTAFKDIFMMDDDHSELQKSLNVMVTQATVNGVPPDKL
ncbi:MAG: phospholipase [Blastocatellia bacterium]|nr:phospholipase [Blastocatellia bacterium]